MSKPDRSLFRSDNVTSLVRNVYAKATETVISREASSASSPEVISILGYNYIRGKDLKPFLFCEFVNRVRMIPNSIVIQHVAYDW
jgi:hypothetical protein